MEKLAQKRAILLQALDTLNQAIARLEKSNYETDPDYEAFRDSLIKRFEYCSDLFWKYIKLVLEKKHGVIVASPRLTYREAATANLLTEEESQTLLKMLDARNQTSHTYRAVFAEELASIIPGYFDCMQEIIAKVTI